MQLSRFSDYSLRVLMYGALQKESFQIDDVTVAYGISRHHLAKVTHHLSKLGYLATRQGRGGGIQLAYSPDEINLGEVLRHTENQSALVECFDPEKNTCVIRSCCRLKGILAKALESFFQSLDQHTIRDLITGPHRKAMKSLLLPEV